MHVWRIPLPFFAALFASTSLAFVWIGVVGLRRRGKNDAFRGLLLAIAVVATILSPFLVQAITGHELEKMAKRGIYVHYSPYVYLAPAFVVALLFGISRLLFPRREPSSVFRWHLKFWLVAFAFAVLNVANWCSPGWCERFGFPFPYSWWSDAIIVMNGENLTAGTSLIALVANISVFVFVVAALARSYRRSVTARSPVDNPSIRNSGSAPR